MNQINYFLGTTIMNKMIPVISFVAISVLGCRSTANGSDSNVLGANGANVNHCTSLPTGDFKYAEQDKVRGKVRIDRQSAGIYKVKVNSADDISGFRVGTYTLKLASTQPGDVFECTATFFDQNNKEIVLLSNPILPMTKAFHSGLTITADGSISIETSGFTGCGGEGTGGGGCAPAEGLLIPVK